MPWIRDVVEGAVTDRVLVAAPGADRQIQVQAVDISTAPANTVTLHSGGGDILFMRHMAATSYDHVEGNGAGLLLADPNETLTFTTTGAGQCYVSVEFDFVRARTVGITTVISPALVDQTVTVSDPQLDLGFAAGLVDQSAAPFDPQLDLAFAAGLMDQTAATFDPVVSNV